MAGRLLELLLRDLSVPAIEAGDGGCQINWQLLLWGFGGSLIDPGAGECRLKWPVIATEFFLTAQMSVLMVFCGPHLPLAFRFVCGPGGGFLFVWLRHRRRPRDTVQIVVFVGGPLLKTFVPL